MDDPRLPNQAYAAFVRSPHAHARIVSVNAEDARKASGVLAVLTADDMKAAGVGSISRHPPVPGRGGAKMAMPFRPALAGDKVMHVGDPVALVVAESHAAGAGRRRPGQVDYEELPPVIELDDGDERQDAAARRRRPAISSSTGRARCRARTTKREVDRIIKQAAHVARVTVTNQRMVVASMETRGATGEYDAANDSYTLHACSQSAAFHARAGRRHHGRGATRSCA